MTDRDSIDETTGLVSVAEAARLSGVTAQRMDQVIEAGQLPSQWIGSQRTIRLVDLRYWQRHVRRRPGRPRKSTTAHPLQNP